MINNEIVYSEMRVIFGDENLGIISKNEALMLSEKEGLDLVLISDNDTPICKIMDYSKFLYNQKKKEKKNKKNNPKKGTKKLQFKPNTDINDINRLVNQTIDFIKKGNDVRFNVRFKNRELHLCNIVINKFNHIVSNIPNIEYDMDDTINNNNMNLIIKGK